MAILEIARPHKRRHVEPGATEPIESKRQKFDSNCIPSPSPEHYLDTLPRIWLTRGALNEFNRRTHERDPYRNRAKRQERRPVTRAFHRKLRSQICATNARISDFWQRSEPQDLRKLKRYAKNGGPDLRHLSGFKRSIPRRHAMSTIPISSKKIGKRGSQPTLRTAATRAAITKASTSYGSYGPNFEQRMIDNKIFPDNYEHPDGRAVPVPENFKDIQATLAVERSSLSASFFLEDDFRAFTRADSRITSENRATTLVLPLIQGTTPEENFIEGNVLFNNLADMMQGKSHKAKPDLYYGSRPEQLDPAIRSQLNAHIVPSKTHTRPIVPNFFVEAKQPAGSARVALNQACFAGATGARGIHRLQTCGEDVPTYDNNAYTLSATYHSSQLRIYAHHIAQPFGPGSRPEYYMNQLGAFALTHSRDALVVGLTAFRNAVDWTAAQRKIAVAAATSVWAEKNNADAGEADDEGDPESYE